MPNFSHYIPAATCDSWDSLTTYNDAFTLIMLQKQLGFKRVLVLSIKHSVEQDETTKHLVFSIERSLQCGRRSGIGNESWMRCKTELWEKMKVKNEAGKCEAFIKIFFCMCAGKQHSHVSIQLPKGNFQCKVKLRNQPKMTI